MQERRNSIANALKLRLSYINQVVTGSNFKLVLEIKDVLKFKDAVLKFGYDCNPRLLFSYCKIAFDNLCSTK